MARREIDGQCAIVTGASGGIGRALALELARRGARLLVTARRGELLFELAAEVRAGGGEAHLVAGDITDAEIRRQVVETAEDRFGRLDMLVNNAGVGAYGPFASAGPDRLRRIMEVNFFAPLELTRLALPLLRKGNKPILVNIGSVLGHRAVPGKSEYAASKFALHGMSDALRAEFAGEGIDVLLVSPSTTSSEFSAHVIDGGEKPPRVFGRPMSPQEVARRTVRAIRRGSHEIILGNGAAALVWLDRLTPSWADWLVARYG